MDESTDTTPFAILKIMPCEMASLGSQKCCFSQSLMNDLGVKFNDAVKITCGASAFICRALPASFGSDETVWFDRCVVRDTMLRTASSKHHQLLPASAIERLQCQALESV